MNWWLILGTTIVGVGLLLYLIHLGMKAQEGKELKRVNRELNQSVDNIVAAEHRKDKINADHEARLVEIAGTHGLNRERIKQLLDSWPGETPAPGAPPPAAH